MSKQAALMLPVALVALGTVCLSLTPVAAQSTTTPASASHSSAANNAASFGSATGADTLPMALAAIEKAIDAKRDELHVPGASLVIVKDDKILTIKGLGLKDVARKLPVTPDTLFAIGSSTKAFTAMTVMMSVEEGKLKLTDPPNKYLPYFKLRDPEADRQITISDLLCHRSGLPRTDLAMMTGVLNSRELIELLGHVKPTAKFGEKFQYQNLMFLTAGEVVAAVQQKPWADVVTQHILKPLGMKASNLSIPKMLKAPDYALGYRYDADKKEYIHLPMRNIAAVAPAGAINSNAKDMAQWLRLMTGQGIFEGKRLITQESYDLLTTKHMTIGGGIDYGYGWTLSNWHGHKVVEHGGSIDGFNAEVAFMPDQKLGFALLTNVTVSSLGETALETIWQNLVGTPQNAQETASAGSATDPALEVGIYHLPAANLDIKIALENGKLKATMPGQPVYTLVNIGGRRYKIADPPLAGYFATFRPQQSDPTQLEMEIEQPQGKFVLPRVTATATANTPQQADYNSSMKDLIATYKATKSPFTLDIAVKNGKICIYVVGQPPYPLIETAKDAYKLGGAPDGFNVTIRRDPAGKVTGIHLQQPQGDMDLTRQEAFTAPITVDELMQKEIDALGGEPNLRRHHTKRVDIEVDMENEGVTAKGRIYRQAPNAMTTDLTMYALGKKILTQHEYFDGTHGGVANSLAPAKTFSDKEIATARTTNDFYEQLDWKTRYKSVTIKRMDKVDGEDAYVVEMTPNEGDPITDYISAKTFLLLRRDTLIPRPGTENRLPSSELYSDYRVVDGEKIPFRVTDKSVDSSVITTVRRIRFDIPIPERVFK